MAKTFGKTPLFRDCAVYELKDGIGPGMHHPCKVRDVRIDDGSDRLENKGLVLVGVAFKKTEDDPPEDWDEDGFLYEVCCWCLPSDLR